MSLNRQAGQTLSEQFRTETERELNAALIEGVDPKREYDRLISLLRTCGKASTGDSRTATADNSEPGARDVTRIQVENEASTIAGCGCGL